MWGILSPPYHIRKRQNAPEKCDPLSTTICAVVTVHPCSILVDPFEELIFISDRKNQKKTVNPSFTVPLIWSTFTVSAPRDQIRNFPWQRLKEGSIGATLMNLNCRKGKLLPANRLIIWLRNPDLWGFSIKSFSLSLYLSLSSNVSKVRSNQDRSSKVLSNYICLCVSGKYVCPSGAFALDRK